MAVIEKYCLACGKPLKGRVDKKFCDDYCRSAFNNNKKNTEQSVFMRSVDKTLRKNRSILSSLLDMDHKMKKVTRKQLFEAGFNFDYFTHLYKNHKQQTYFFIYEYGYLLLEDDWVLVVQRKENSE